MLIRYRRFASLAEAAGETGGSAELSGSASVQDLWEELDPRGPLSASEWWKTTISLASGAQDCPRVGFEITPQSTPGWLWMRGW